MSRPSKNTDELLINAAKQLLPETGASGLSMRKVAAKAKVNLGMFHYHFKSKEEFTQRVLETIYEEFFKKFSLETTEGTSLERLRKALFLLGQFSRDNRKLIVSLISDILNGDKEVIRFVKSNIGRHFKILGQLISECIDQGLIDELPLPILLFQILGVVGIPHLAIEFIQRMGVLRPFGVTTSVITKSMLTDSALSKRVEFALKSVVTKKGAQLL